MDTNTPRRSIVHFELPLGHQEVDLAQIEFSGGGVPLLRVRIREGKRFTIFDVDPVTARDWGAAMHQWGQNTLDAVAESPSNAQTGEAAGENQKGNQA